MNPDAASERVKAQDEIYRELERLVEIWEGHPVVTWADIDCLFAELQSEFQ